MHGQKIMVFTDEEEELINLLIKVGTRRNVASTLIFLANVPEATSREIERGADLQQPAVSMAIQHLTEKGWITCQGILSDGKGRPMKKYSLAVPFEDIIASIEKEKKNEVTNRLVIIQTLRNNIDIVSG